MFEQFKHDIIETEFSNWHVLRENFLVWLYENHIRANRFFKIQSGAYLPLIISTRGLNTRLEINRCYSENSYNHAFKVLKDNYRTPEKLLQQIHDKNGIKRLMLQKDNLNGKVKSALIGLILIFLTEALERQSEYGITDETTDALIRELRNSPAVQEYYKAVEFTE